MTAKVSIVISLILAVIIVIANTQQQQQQQQQDDCSEAEMRMTNLVACTAIRNENCQEDFEKCLRKQVPQIKNHIQECRKKHLKSKKGGEGNRKVFIRLCMEGKQNNNNARYNGGGMNLGEEENKTLCCLCTKLGQDGLSKARDRMTECIDQLKNNTCRRPNNNKG